MTHSRFTFRWHHALFSFIFALIIGAFLWLKWLDLPINVSIPAPKMPKPNAYDYYVAANELVVDVDLVRWAISPDPRTNPRAHP